MPCEARKVLAPPQVGRLNLTPSSYIYHAIHVDLLNYNPVYIEFYSPYAYLLWMLFVL